jgi:hypothetical protein
VLQHATAVGLEAGAAGEELDEDAVDAAYRPGPPGAVQRP